VVSMVSKSGILKTNWQHFLAAGLLTICYPLLPLFVEYMLADRVTDKTVLITAIMYCSALAVVSRSVWVFGLGFVASILLAIFFGITFYNAEHGPAHSASFGWFCIAFFAICHIFERYDMHVVRGQNFIEFGKAK
jgi:hypothetical protein